MKDGIDCREKFGSVLIEKNSKYCPGWIKIEELEYAKEKLYEYGCKTISVAFH
jgi:hypothetical protein